MLATSLVMGHYFTALLLVITAAAVLGFLHFNFPPATVFMGDAGSLFLGFLLASLGLASSVKAATVVAIFVPVVALGLPVLDTFLVVLRRVLRGERISKADRGHIHHRLVDLGCLAATAVPLGLAWLYYRPGRIGGNASIFQPALRPQVQIGRMPWPEPVAR